MTRIFMEDTGILKVLPADCHHFSAAYETLENRGGEHRANIFGMTGVHALRGRCSLGRGGVVGSHRKPLSGTLLIHMCMDVCEALHPSVSFLANTPARDLMPNIVAQPALQVLGVRFMTHEVLPPSLWPLRHFSVPDLLLAPLGWRPTGPRLRKTAAFTGPHCAAGPFGGPALAAELHTQAECVRGRRREQRL
jgi:hypothetical protein